MHAERDYLRRVIFPELEERLSQRRCHLEVIDFRWGIDSGSQAQEATNESLILKVCLGEIERTKPFFIGLLGDRYGWVPPDNLVMAIAREVGYERPVIGRSITELEIDFAI
jgi:hypothetical protein